MNATATPIESSSDARDAVEIALADWRKIVGLIHRYGMADRVLSCNRSVMGFGCSIQLELIEDLEVCFAGTGLLMRLSRSYPSRKMHAEIVLGDMRVTACGDASGRTEGVVTL